MAYATEVQEFSILMARELTATPPHHVSELIRKLLRYANKLDRLAVAQCNGDYPADNGERKVLPCSRCEAGFVRSAMKRSNAGLLICPDCATQDRVTLLLAPLGIVPIFGGDPRGCVLKLKLPSGIVNDFGNTGVCVPARSH